MGGQHSVRTNGGSNPRFYQIEANPVTVWQTCNRVRLLSRSDSDVGWTNPKATDQMAEHLAPQAIAVF